MPNPEDVQPTPDFHAEARPFNLDPDRIRAARAPGLEVDAMTKRTRALGHITHPGNANAMDAHYEELRDNGTLDVHRRYTT